MKPRVFVVQQPAVYCRDRREFVPKYDLSPAAKHGRLEFLLGPGNIFKDRMEQATRQLAKALETCTDKDFILAVGDPVAIAAAILIAGARTGGIVNLLKYDRISGGYENFRISACVTN